MRKGGKVGREEGEMERGKEGEEEGEIEGGAWE